MTPEAQQTLITVLTFLYIASSYIGYGLFTWTYKEAVRDRRELSQDTTMTAKERSVLMLTANRACRVGGTLALVFGLYSVAGTMALLDKFGLVKIPMEEGLFTTSVLVFANILEMLIALVLVKTRRQLHQAKS